MPTPMPVQDRRGKRHPVHCRVLNHINRGFEYQGRGLDRRRPASEQIARQAP